MEVHNNLGHGFLEPVYQEALAIELRDRDIPYDREKELQIHYKQHTLQKRYLADFLCYEKIIVEIKALSGLTSDHTAQALNYLKATSLQLALLVNFGSKSLQYQRIVL